LPDDFSHNSSATRSENAVKLPQAVIKEGAQSSATEQGVKARCINCQSVAISQLEFRQVIQAAHLSLVFCLSDEVIAQINAENATAIFLDKIQLQFSRSAGNAEQSDTGIELEMRLRFPHQLDATRHHDLSSIH
jgi:hypothetical protein